MKSSTLHRSNLTKERMSMLENIRFQGKHSFPAGSSYESVRVNKTPELDVLYRSLGKISLKKSVSQGGSAAAGKTKPNAPGVYLSLGFIGGAVFLVIVGLVVWISSIPAKKPADSDAPKTNANLEVVTETADTTGGKLQEKYIIKSGDTLDRIAYRFYGRYDVNKIEEIKKINNITNPEGLQIGQVLIIPLEK